MAFDLSSQTFPSRPPTLQPFQIRDSRKIAIAFPKPRALVNMTALVASDEEFYCHRCITKKRKLAAAMHACCRSISRAQSPRAHCVRLQIHNAICASVNVDRRSIARAHLICTYVYMHMRRASRARAIDFDRTYAGSGICECELEI